MSEWSDKIAIITGAGTGIGAAVAEAFIEKGARIALVGRRKEKLEEVAEGCSQDQVICCPCDVSDRDSVNSMAEEVASRFGTVNVLVNNAGFNTKVRSLADVVPEDWDKTVNINLTGAFNCIRAVLPGMRELKDGLIINVSSIAGIRASVLGGVAYTASKHGMVALSLCTELEEGENGIRCCAICPGEVETPILDERPVPVGPEHRARILQPEDVAAAAVFVTTLPKRASVSELVIKPTLQGFG